MSNQTITKENYNTQMLLFPELKEEKKEEKANTSKSKEPNPRKLAPTFKPYDHRQIHIIYDIESLIPENHVAHNILKVAGIRQLLSGSNNNEKRRGEKNFFHLVIYFRDFLDSPFFYEKNHIFLPHRVHPRRKLTVEEELKNE